MRRDVKLLHSIEDSTLDRKELGSCIRVEG